MADMDDYPAARASWPSVSELWRAMQEERGLSDHICHLPAEAGWHQCKCGAWGHVTLVDDAMTIQPGEAFTINGPPLNLSADRDAREMYRG